LAAYFFSKQAVAGFIRLTPTGRTEKSLLLVAEFPMESFDVDAGHIYWTNMGVPNRNDGSIERADLDGQNRVTIVNEGATSLR
jgi:hypothetical protein